MSNNNQCINCEVCDCHHNDNACKCCSLSTITVTNHDSVSSAHYCKNYRPSKGE